MKLSHMQLSADRRHGGLMGGLLVAVVLVSILGWLAYTFIFKDDGGVSQDSLITQKVSRGAFDHVVLEQGEIESSSNTEVICEVRSRSGGSVSILWVADEGTKVDKGDKLVELDSSQLVTQVKEDKIQVTMASANVTTAKAKLEQAKIAREEYLEGIYKTEEKAIQSEMAIAEQELRKAELALGSSQRLVAKGLVKSLQLDADKFAVANAQNQLEGAKGRLKVLQNLTRKKMLVQYDSDIEAAAAQLSAYESEMQEEELELAETEAQIKKCVMNAPSAGVVVHANQYSSRGGNAEFVVEAGATVRERQAIIRLPDPSQMQIKCKINESRITLIKEGMPVKIAVDAIPGMKLQGRVKKVNRYAEPGSFFSSNIKEYATIVEIVNPPESIRTGMTAEAQIFVEQLEDAVQIPIQGLYEHGDKMYSLVQTGPQSFETRLVKIGATNDTMAS
ncbi:MAG: efflux RND transporter periplasmic adaptor subunit, partial [Pirellulaceae bacterium]